MELKQLRVERAESAVGRAENRYKLNWNSKNNYMKAKKNDQCSSVIALFYTFPVPVSIPVFKIPF